MARLVTKDIDRGSIIGARRKPYPGWECILGIARDASILRHGRIGVRWVHIPNAASREATLTPKIKVHITGHGEIINATLGSTKVSPPKSGAALSWGWKHPLLSDMLLKIPVADIKDGAIIVRKMIVTTTLTASNWFTDVSGATVTFSMLDFNLPLVRKDNLIYQAVPLANKGNILGKISGMAALLD